MGEGIADLFRRPYAPFVPPVPVKMPPRQRVTARLRNYLAAGVLVTAPLGITAWLAWSVVSFFDEHIRRVVPGRYQPEGWLGITLPGFGLVVSILVVTLIGWLTANIGGRYLVQTGERVLNRMPVIRSIYGAVKQVIEAAVVKGEGSFRQVVMIEFPRAGSWTIGFVTGRPAAEIRDVAGQDSVAVFVPTSPNPTSGYLLFVPHAEVRHLEMTVEQGLKLIVSSGIVQEKENAPPA